MRILLLNWRDVAHPASGGAERYVDELARRWVELGHRVTLFSSRFPGSSAAEKRRGYSVVRSGGRLSIYPQAARYLADTKGEWDLVVESINTRPFFAHRLASGTPTLALFHQLARDVWFHEAPFPAAVLGRYVLEPRWLRRYRDAPVVAVSDSTRDDLERIGIRSAAVVPPGVSPAPAGTWLKERDPTLLFVGRMARNKRPQDALESWKRARQRIPEVKLWMVGDGPLRPELERAAGDGAVIHGRVDEPKKWELMARAHLLLVPSVREGWGIVVMEAAVARTAALGYRVPGLLDAIVEGETGWLCEPRPEALADAAVRALKDPSLHKTSSRARTRALDFTWDRTAERILAVAEDAVGAA